MKKRCFSSWVFGIGGFLHLSLCNLGKFLIILVIPFSVNAEGVGKAESTLPWIYSGWVCDSDFPGYQSVVQAWRDDGKLLDNVVASGPVESDISHACRSPHNAHGFRMGIDTQPEWMDGKVHDVTLYVVGRKGVKTPIRTFSVNFSNANEGISPPRNPGDIVGRDLDRKPLGPMGHIGIWDGQKVVEMLDERSDISKVFRNSWADFQSRTATWPTAYPNYPKHTIKTCFARTCDVNNNRPGEVVVDARQAVFSRALQVYSIGAEYTWSPDFKTAEPEMIDFQNGFWKRKLIFGRYRCDTFIYDAFRASTDLDTAGVWPARYVYNMHYSWRDKVVRLYGFAMTPASVMNKVRDFK